MLSLCIHLVYLCVCVVRMLKYYTNRITLYIVYILYALSSFDSKENNNNNECIEGSWMRCSECCYCCRCCYIKFRSKKKNEEKRQWTPNINFVRYIEYNVYTLAHALGSAIPVLFLLLLFFVPDITYLIPACSAEHSPNRDACIVRMQRTHSLRSARRLNAWNR